MYEELKVGDYIIFKQDGRKVTGRVTYVTPTRVNVDVIASHYVRRAGIIKRLKGKPRSWKVVGNDEG